MSRTPLPPCPRKSAPLWCIFFALPALNDPQPVELKFTENTVQNKGMWNQVGITALVSSSTQAAGECVTDVFTTNRPMATWNLFVLYKIKGCGIKSV